MIHTCGAYFSPTGSTKRALAALCGLFSGEADLVELTGPKKETRSLGAEDLLILALPVYAGQIPAVPGLLDGLKGENTPCVLVATYGNRHYDNALAQMKRLMEARGFRCVGAAAVITPHIFAPTLGVGRPDGEDLEVLARFAQVVKDKLASGAADSVEVPGDPEPPAHPAVPVKKDRDWDTCLGCGFCAKVCPTGAMDPKTLMWDAEKCISCMACVSRCPVGALGYNSAAIATRLTEKFSERRPVEVFL